MSRDGLPPPPSTVQALSMAVYPSYAMLAGMQLELFTALENGPSEVNEVAAALGVGPEKLRPLLFALTAAGLLEEAGGRFANTPESDHDLVKGRPHYLGDLKDLLADVWPAALQVGASIRTGAPQAKHDFSAMSEAELTTFLRGLSPGTVASAHLLAKHFDFGACETLLDVAGGSGALAATLCRSYPGLKASVLELPQVAAITERFVAEAGLAERVDVLAADPTRAPLEGNFDVMVMRSFLQVLSAEDARHAILNTVPALKPGGTLHILGIGVLADSRLAPQEAVDINLVFLSVYDHGQSYTVGEYQAWLDEAGYGTARRTEIPGGQTLLSAVKGG